MTTDPRAVRRGRAITEGVWQLDPQDMAVLLLAHLRTQRLSSTSGPTQEKMAPSSAYRGKPM